MACARWLLPVPPGPRKSASSRLANESGGGEVEDEAAVHLRVEGEVEIVERTIGIPEAGLLAPALQQAIGPAFQFVGDQAGDEVDGRHRFSLRLMDSGFEHGSHAAEAELPE